MRFQVAALCLVASLTPHRAFATEFANGAWRFDVTEVSIASQRFLARHSEGERLQDQGWGMWLNRVQASLGWKTRWSLGARLDSAVYWLRPEGRFDIDESLAPTVRRDGASRFRNSVYPAKLWASYTAPGLEVTVGDAYVQFGRGLVLSMRKLDDLGIDTTLRGAKVAWQSDPYAVTAVAGFANPSRVDEVSGRSLFATRPLAQDFRGSMPLFGSDRIAGIDVQAGRGGTAVISLQGVGVQHCAPYAYDSAGQMVDRNVATHMFGTCAKNDTAMWLGSLPTALGPMLNADRVIVAGGSIDVPNLDGLGTLYAGIAIQNRKHGDIPGDPRAEGNAIYATYSGAFGRVTNTLEFKSYRNFYPIAAAIDANRAPEFINVAYSSAPTAEVVTQDSAFGFFNACVNGGRLRTDVRIRESLLIYGQAIHAQSKSELGATCDRMGRIYVGPLARAADLVTNVWDGLVGVEWTFDKSRSHLFASAGGRSDVTEADKLFYREAHIQYAFAKQIRGAYSIELVGRHRLREEAGQNQRGPSQTSEPWREGEHYTSLKIAPKWVLSQGFEYTTRLGYPTYYVNGSALYRITDNSNIRAFVGEQRGGLRCVNGVCRMFPAFAGAKIEVTLRF